MAVGELVELAFRGGVIPVKAACAVAYRQVDLIRSAAAAHDLGVTVTAAQSGGTCTLHFQFDSWATGTRALDWWPGNGKWYRPATGEKGREDDWRVAVELAAMRAR